MFQNLNPLDKPTAILEIIVMLVVAAAIGFFIGHILQKLNIDKLKSELRFRDSKYSTLNKRHDDIINEQRDAEATISDLRKRKSNLIAELDDLKTENNDLKKEIENLINNSNNNSEVKSLNAYIARLKKDKEDLKSKINKTDDLSAYEDEIEELKQEIEKLSDTNKTLQKNIDEFNRSKTDTSEIKALNAYIARLKKDKEDLKGKINSIKNTKEIEALNSTISELTQSNEALKAALNKANQPEITSQKIESVNTNKDQPKTQVQKPPIQPNEASKPLTLEAFKIKKMALFQSIGTASETEKDNLVEINGIGPLIEAKLNTIGIYTFNQIVNFTDKDIANVTDLIEFFPGRIKRDQWVQQAKQLVSEKVNV